jgi:hypothetical protein
VDHEVRLHRPHPSTDRGTEIRRTRHPVLRRKHRTRPCVDPRRITQSACGGPCRGDSTRSPGLPGSASAAGIRALARGAGCSAEKSACPWPRLSLLNSSGARAPPLSTPTGGTRPPLVSSCVSLASPGAVSRHPRVAAVSPLSGDCTRVLTRFAWVKPGSARAKSRSNG